MPVAGLAIGAVDLDHINLYCPEPAGQPSTIGPGAFNPDPYDRTE